MRREKNKRPIDKIAVESSKENSPQIPIKPMVSMRKLNVFENANDKSAATIRSTKIPSLLNNPESPAASKNHTVIPMAKMNANKRSKLLKFNNRFIGRFYQIQLGRCRW